jgi:ATP-dependent protease HslVU (ClpYQ) peptidase subunit
MTCTIGFLDGRQVYIATDSASTAEDGHIVVRHGNTKAWTVQVRHGPELLVGFSGNFTDLNFIRYMFQWPKWRSPSMMHYLVSQVAPALKQELKANISEPSWTLLIGTRCDGPSLYVVYDNGDVERPLKPYCAIGSASDFAMGALETTVRHTSWKPWEHLEEALHVAEEHHVSVRRPFHMLVL